MAIIVRLTLSATNRAKFKTDQKTPLQWVQKPYFGLTLSTIPQICQYGTHNKLLGEMG